MSFSAVAWAMKIPTGGAYNKITLLILADHYNQETELCCPSIKRIAKIGEMSDSTVKRALKQLADKGVIDILHRTRQDGSMMSNQYRLTPRFGKPDDYRFDHFDVPLWGKPLGDPEPVQSEPTPRPDRPTNNLEYNLEDKPIGQNGPDGTFDQWWEVYPKKVKKQAAKKLWYKHKRNLIAEKLIQDVRNRKENCRQWKSGYVPDPTTYLNGERWDDEIQKATPKQNAMRLPRDVNALMVFGTKMGFPAKIGEDERPYRERLMVELSRTGTAQ